MCCTLLSLLSFFFSILQWEAFSFFIFRCMFLFEPVSFFLMSFFLDLVLAQNDLAEAS